MQELHPKSLSILQIRSSPLHDIFFSIASLGPRAAWHSFDASALALQNCRSNPFKGR